MPNDFIAFAAIDGGESEAIILHRGTCQECNAAISTLREVSYSGPRTVRYVDYGVCPVDALADPKLIEAVKRLELAALAAEPKGPEPQS